MRLKSLVCRVWVVHFLEKKLFKQILIILLLVILMIKDYQGKEYRFFKIRQVLPIFGWLAECGPPEAAGNPSVAWSWWPGSTLVVTSYQRNQWGKMKIDLCGIVKSEVDSGLHRSVSRSRPSPLLLWGWLVSVRRDFIPANLIPDPIEGLFFLEIF